MADKSVKPLGHPSREAEKPAPEKTTESKAKAGDSDKK
jgi:hypothetical protein